MHSVGEMDGQNYERCTAMTYASFLRTYCSSSYRKSEGCNIPVKNHEHSQTQTHHVIKSNLKTDFHMMLIFSLMSSSSCNPCVQGLKVFKVFLNHALRHVIESKHEGPSLEKTIHLNEVVM